MKKLVMTFAIAATMASCGDHTPEKSETLKQAEQVHEQVVQLSEDVATMIHSKTDMVGEKMQEYAAAGDSISASKLEMLNGKLEALHTKFHDVENGIVEIPGHEHTHADGEACDHDHDHAQEALMEGLSDEQHLEIQSEQKRLLEELKSEIESISLENTISE